MGACGERQLPDPFGPRVGSRAFFALENRKEACGWWHTGCNAAGGQRRALRGQRGESLPPPAWVWLAVACWSDRWVGFQEERTYDPHRFQSVLRCIICSLTYSQKPQPAMRWCGKHTRTGSIPYRAPKYIKRPVHRSCSGVKRDCTRSLGACSSRSTVVLTSCDSKRILVF